MTIRENKVPMTLPENGLLVAMWYQPQTEIVPSDCNVVCGVEGGMILVESWFTVEKVPNKLLPGIIKTATRTFKVNVSEYRNIMRFVVRQ